MTEEQLEKRAEEYGHEWGTPTDDSYACCRQGFIDGYHEGFKDCAKAKLNVTTISDCPIKYEWHDLRKNPKDLPTEDCKDYLAITLDDTEPGVFMYIASEQGQWEWEPRRIAFYTNDQIKAWCEIPTFEEDA